MRTTFHRNINHGFLCLRILTGPKCQKVSLKIKISVFKDLTFQDHRFEFSRQRLNWELPSCGQLFNKKNRIAASVGILKVQKLARIGEKPTETSILKITFIKNFWPGFFLQGLNHQFFTIGGLWQKTIIVLFSSVAMLTVRNSKSAHNVAKSWYLIPFCLKILASLFLQKSHSRFFCCRKTLSKIQHLYATATESKHLQISTLEIWEEFFLFLFQLFLFQIFFVKNSKLLSHLKDPARYSRNNTTSLLSIT